MFALHEKSLFKPKKAGASWKMFAQTKKGLRILDLCLRTYFAMFLPSKTCLFNCKNQLLARLPAAFPVNLFAQKSFAPFMPIISVKGIFCLKGTQD